jgi:xanthomonalisin
MLCLCCPLQAADNKEVSGQVPQENSQSTLLGPVVDTKTLHLAVGLELQNTNELQQLLSAVSDPNSPKFRQFLSSEEFNSRFAPKQADYNALIQYAESNQLQYTAYSNRMILDISGLASKINRALHIQLNRYNHPHRGQYFAPDRNPTLPNGLHITSIQGLTDLNRPQPHLHRAPSPQANGAHPSAGSGASGSFLGNDFRTAYAQGTTLTGAGQSVGLLQFDGYYPADITAYAQLAGNGRTNITVSYVPNILRAL